MERTGSDQRWGVSLDHSDLPFPLRVREPNGAVWDDSQKPRCSWRAFPGKDRRPLMTSLHHRCSLTPDLKTALTAQHSRLLSDACGKLPEPSNNAPLSGLTAAQSLSTHKRILFTQIANTWAMCLCACTCVCLQFVCRCRSVVCVCLCVPVCVCVCSGVWRWCSGVWRRVEVV